MHRGSEVAKPTGFDNLTRPVRKADVATLPGHLQVRPNRQCAQRYLHHITGFFINRDLIGILNFGQKRIRIFLEAHLFFYGIDTRNLCLYFPYDLHKGPG